MAGIRINGNFGDFAALQGYGAWYDDVLGLARQVIPQGTIVGNAIGSTRPKHVEPQPYPYAPGTGPAAVPVNSAGGLLSGDTGTLLLVGGVVLLGAMLFMKKGRR